MIELWHWDVSVVVSTGPGSGRIPIQESGDVYGNYAATWDAVGAMLKRRGMEISSIMGMPYVDSMAPSPRQRGEVTIRVTVSAVP